MLTTVLNSAPRFFVESPHIEVLRELAGDRTIAEARIGAMGENRSWLQQECPHNASMRTCCIVLHRAESLMHTVIEATHALHGAYANAAWQWM